MQSIAIDQLQPGRYQPRRDFNPQALAELAASIEQQGIIEPLILRPIAGDQYEIIAGERRWRAAKQAGLTEVPCIVRRYTDEQAAEISLIENIQREDLNPLEQAHAYQQLIDRFGYIHDEIATAMGKSRANITNTLRLLNLHGDVQKMIISQLLSAGHAKVLAALSANQQVKLAKSCVEKGWSVRQLEKFAQQVKSGAKQDDKTDANIHRMERLLSEKFSTQAKLEAPVNQQSGWLKIHYHDHEVLAGILQKMGIDA